MANTVSADRSIERGFTTAQVAEAMGCHVATVRRHIKAGRITAFWWGAEYRISESELDRVLREGASLAGGREGGPR